MQLFMKSQILIFFLICFPYIVNCQNEPVPILLSKEKTIIDGKTYILHTVKQGETLFSICRAYNVVLKDIIAINPDANVSIKTGQVLKIPTDPMTPKIPSSLNSENYILHIVEAGQTIYSITQKYNITKEELFKHNPELEVSQSLQTGQVVKIPKITTISLNKETVSQNSQIIEHKIKRKETLYSISRLYQVSVDDIIKINPELNTNDIKTGQTIKIPSGKKVETQTNVLVPASDSNVTHPAIIKLFEPCTAAQNNIEHKIAFLLPLYLEENKTLLELDSLNTVEKKGQEDKLIYSKSKNLIEFYEGALIAIDSLKKAGYSYKIYVYDTGRDIHKMTSILGKPEIADMEIFIGPFDSLLLEKALPFAKDHNIKVISPLSQNVNLLKGNPQLYQVNPAESSKIDGAIQYLATQKNKNIILVKSNRVGDKDIFNLFEQKLNLLRTQGLQFKLHAGNKDGALSSKLESDKENLIIMPSVEETAISDVLRNMNYVNEKYKISIFGLPKWATFSSTEISYLHNLQFEYYTSFFVDYSRPAVKQFLLKDHEHFKTEPDAQSFGSQGYNYCFLGYDVTFYFLSALAKFGRNFEACLPTHQVDLLQSDFHFTPSQNGDGTMNHLVNIVRYNKDYSISKVH
jgi:LysM repeat protein